MEEAGAGECERASATGQRVAPTGHTHPGELSRVNLVPVRRGSSLCLVPPRQHLCMLHPSIERDGCAQESGWRSRAAPRRAAAACGTSEHDQVMFLWRLRLCERLLSPCLPCLQPYMVQRAAFVGMLIAAGYCCPLSIRGLFCE